MTIDPNAMKLAEKVVAEIRQASGMTLVENVYRIITDFGTIAPRMTEGQKEAEAQVSKITAVMLRVQTSEYSYCNISLESESQMDRTLSYLRREVAAIADKVGDLSARAAVERAVEAVESVVCDAAPGARMPQMFSEESTLELMRSVKERAIDAIRKLASPAAGEGRG